MIKQIIQKTGQVSKNMSTITTLPSEYDEQKKCIEYLEILKLKGEKILYSATAQSTFTTSYTQKRKNKSMGVRAGVPDLIIIINENLVFIELKRIKKSVVSPDQLIWINTLKEAGQYAKICYGFKEFEEYINRFRLIK